MIANVGAFYFLLGHLIRISKFNMLEKQRVSKERWREQRQNAESFKQARTLLGAEFTEDEQAKRMFPDMTALVLIGSNTFLFLSNVFILLSLA